jgi:hypothetical protein
MGFRFRRPIRILPGIRLNIGRRGVSTSVGVRGAHVTVGHGQVRETVGVPGSGLSYTHLGKSRPPNCRGVRRGGAGRRCSGIAAGQGVGRVAVDRGPDRPRRGHCAAHGQTRRMNLEQLKQNVGWHVQLQPPAIRSDNGK